jgi:ABC-type transport system substrate-binding protein
MAFLFMAVSPALSVAYDVPSDLNIGPYVDKLVYKVITNPDTVILSLQAGTIEMDNSFFDPIHYGDLDADPDITIASALRNGYGHITINCDKFPLNLSVFRKAFAFAFDKYRVTSEVHDGYNQEHDSLVPYISSFCIEDELPYHYYSANAALANQMLDAAGFGWTGTPYDYEGGSRRTTPITNEPFSVNIEYGDNSENIAGGTARIGVDALRSMGVESQSVAANFNEYISRLDSHGDYDMVFFAFNFQGNDISTLGDTFYGPFADLPYQNRMNFRNATFDSYYDDLRYGVTYEEVYEAGKQMQLILHQNVPRLVVYENTYNQAYRNDVFTGHIMDAAQYITGRWTMRKIHKIDGTPGGTVSISLGEEPDSFNIFTSNSAYSFAIIRQMWPALYNNGPDMAPFPDLAESLLTETHDDNPAVPEGHTRFTIDIIQNATWSDGVQLTAEDVAFTYTYDFESGVYGNPAVVPLNDLVAAYAPTPYRVVVEFSTESYWHFNNFAGNWIIPKHIFNDVDGVGYENWNSWNPVFDPEEPAVTCGPFEMTDFTAGEFYEVTANPDYHWFPQEDTTPTTTPPPSTTPTETPFDPTLAIVAGAVGAAVVILVGGFVLLRQK